MPGREKQVARYIDESPVEEARKAHEKAKLIRERLEEKLKAAQEEERRLEEEARLASEKEEARQQIVRRFGRYLEVDPKLKLARKRIRDLIQTASVGTQVSESDLAGYQKEQEQRLRYRLEQLETRAELLLKTLPKDPEEARKAFEKKDIQVRECYDLLTEKIVELRKRVREEYGDDPIREKREKQYERRRELKELRAKGLADPPKKRNRTKGPEAPEDPTTASHSPVSDEVTVILDPELPTEDVFRTEGVVTEDRQPTEETATGVELPTEVSAEPVLPTEETATGVEPPEEVPVEPVIPTEERATGVEQPTVEVAVDNTSHTEASVEETVPATPPTPPVPEYEWEA